MHLLRNGVQTYGWGSVEAIPRFLGTEPDGGPVAEVWIGTHPIKPSYVDETTELKEVAGDLPFMVKLLAADRPLSLQVHPSRAEAIAGYAEEEAAGIPLDAPHRVFKDANHKPEMVYALSTFDSLIGFRPTAEVLRVLSPIDTPLAQQLAEDLRNDPGWQGIVRRIEWLLTQHIPSDEVDQLVKVCQSLAERGMDVKRAYVTATEISKHYPGDVGVVISLMLNRMTLQPGEAAFLETGVIHAHLSGMCLEVMATSDNVMRAGLTDKHVDPEGLVDSLRSGMARIARVNPDFVSVDTEVFSPSDVEFALAVTQVSLADPDGVELIRATSSVLVCTGGEVRVTTPTGDLTLGRGESAYLGPDDREAVVRGLGEVAQVFVPTARALRSRLIDVV